MYNGPRDAADRLKCPLKQVIPALGQNLNRHIIRNQLSVHKLS